MRALGRKGKYIYPECCYETPKEGVQEWREKMEEVKKERGACNLNEGKPNEDKREGGGGKRRM